MHIVITGASGGMGGATARSLSEFGATLHLVGRNEAALQAVAADVEKAGGRCFAYRKDLSLAADRKTLVQELGANAPKIDWVVHSAGSIDPREPERLMDDAEAEAHFALNALAPMSLTRLLAPLLDAEGGMVYVSSSAAIRGNGRFPVYAAAKAALVVFARSMAFRWEGSGLTSIAVCPGPTDTPMTKTIGTDPKKVQPPSAVADVIKRIILKQDYKSGDVVIVRDQRSWTSSSN